MNKQNHMTANRNGIMLLLILALALFLLPAEAGLRRSARAAERT